MQVSHFYIGCQVCARIPSGSLYLQDPSGYFLSLSLSLSLLPSLSLCLSLPPSLILFIDFFFRESEKH